MALNYGYNNANFYMQDLQNMRDRIDRQMAQMQTAQAQQPVPITQNFQLATSNITKGDFDGVISTYNLDVDGIDFYVTMNMMYSDYNKDIEEKLDEYIKMSLDF